MIDCIQSLHKQTIYWVQIIKVKRYNDKLHEVCGCVVREHTLKQHKYFLYNFLTIELNIHN